MNQSPTPLLALTSAVILVFCATTEALPNTQANAREIQPHASGTIAQARRRIDEKSALKAVWRLRQVQQKAKEIERLSRGKARLGLTVDQSPTTATPYYVVQLFENHPDHITTLNWFRVSLNGVITVLDLTTDKYIPVHQWRP
ncbi:MAG TPA: hypothetical protein V6D11_26105 [Waterburya sp.]|jgi:hypothetical protein